VDVRRRAPAIAWTVWGLFVASAAVASVLEWLAGPQRQLDFGVAPALLAYVTVGAIVVARRPGNPLGLCFVGIGVATIALMLGTSYADYAAHTERAVHVGELIALWVASCTWYPLLALATAYSLLLFPSGLPSRRWRPAAWACGASVAVVMVLAVTAPTLKYGSRQVHNPISLHLGKADVEKTIPFQIFGVLFVMTLIASLASLVVRFRRSRGAERKQLEWFVSAAAILAVQTWASVMITKYNTMVANTVVFDVVLTFVPVACGIAILRYRLYDIDRIVSRTVSWALVTSVLVGVYIGVVTAVGSLLPNGSSSYAVAIATLVAVALLQPLRRRLQDFVDRRFDRARYDANRTVAAFAARLRDELDIDDVRTDLLVTVVETVQPAAASLVLLGRS
jgi:hypothetical protein